jgi:hypothetical protein
MPSVPKTNTERAPEHARSLCVIGLMMLAIGVDVDVDVGVIVGWLRRRWM